MRLIVRTPAPKVEESPFGFLLRLSEENGYHDPAILAHVAGVALAQLNAPGFPIHQLADVLGHSGAELRRMSYRAPGGPNRFQVLGHELGASSKRLLRLRNSAFCPDCAAEDGYISAFWDLSVAIACPRHGTYAAHSCFRCGEEFRWRRRGLLLCQCGHKVTPNPAKARSQTLLLMRLIEALLYRRQVPSEVMAAGFPVDELTKIPFASLLQIVHVLGTHLRGEPLGPETFRLLSSPVYAAECLADWPRAYHDSLFSYGERSINGERKAAGARKQFEPLYSTLFKNRGFAVDTEFLREEFVTFALRHWGKGLVYDKLLRHGERISEQRYVSKNEFSRRFKIVSSTVDRLIGQGTLVTQTIEGAKCTRTVIDLQRSELPKAADDVLSARDAAKLAGLPVSVIEELRQRGVLTVQPRLGRQAAWHRLDIESFIARALELPLSDLPCTSIVTIRKAMRLKLGDAAAKADIVAALFDMRLRLVGRAGSDLGEFQVDRLELEQFVLRRRVKLSEHCSLTQAAAATGLDASAILSAIDGGLLDTATISGKLRVTRASIESFNSAYVTLSAIAGRLGTLARVLARLCKENDIPLAKLSRRQHGCLQPVLLRDNEAELLAVWEARAAARTGRGASGADHYNATMRAYLQGLRSTGSKLPRRAGGDPNKLAIARACGLSRHVLFSFPTVIEILTSYNDEEILHSSPAPTPAAALRSYLKRLNDTGLALPRLRNGEPNKVAIARACGFSRDALYRNHEVKGLLSDFDSAERQKVAVDVSQRKIA